MAESDSFAVTYNNPLWEASPQILTPLFFNDITVKATELPATALNLTFSDNLGCVYEEEYNYNVYDIHTESTEDTTICLGDTIDIGLDLLGSDVAFADCDLKLSMYDSFGDGWEGATIDLDINGTTTSYTVATDSVIVDFLLPRGDLLELTYNGGGGNFDNTYNIETSNGEVIFEDGTNPFQGLAFSYTCPTLIEGPLLSVFDTLCPITVDMFDSFGNGWNGCNLIFAGVPGNTTLTTGGAATEVVLSPLEYSITYDIGALNSEVSYDIYGTDGSVIASVAQGAGVAGTTYTGTSIYDPAVCVINETVVPDNVAYTWTSSSSIISENFDAFSPTATISPTANTEYIVSTFTSYGCLLEDTIQVNVSDLVYTITDDPEICGGEDYQLSATGASIYSWSPNIALDDSTLANPTTNTLNTLTYYVEMTDAAGCIKHDSVLVTVHDVPSSGINNGTNPVKFCEGTEAELTAELQLGYTYSWTGPETGTGSSITVSTPGIYTLSFEDEHCAKEITVLVEESLNPVVDLSNLKTALCCEEEMTVNVSDYINNVEIQDIYWNGVLSDGMDIVEPRLEDYIEENVVRVVSIDGCELETYGFTFTTNCMNPSFLSPDTVFLNSSEVFDLSYNADSNAVYSYDWTTTDLSSGAITDNTEENATFNGITENLGYEADVTVTATYTLGDGSTYTCMEEASTRSYDVYEVPAPEYPDAFTPNGDGVNELYRPVVHRLSVIEDLRIYNRWGDLVYDMSTATNKAGWDGKYNGQAQSEDLYIYYVKVKNPAEEYIQEGTVSLIR